MVNGNIMKDKVVLITGATDGIGKEAAKNLAAMDAELVIVGRNPQKTESAVEDIKTYSGNNNVNHLIADLSSQIQIRRLVEDFQNKYDRLDVLINHAGGIFLRRRVSVDGIEMTIALNHLSYFLLTNLLLDVLKASAHSRIVNTSSGSHLKGRINFENINLTRSYFIYTAYSQSKLANVLFTYELARRLECTGVTVNCQHPGFVRTNMGASDNVLVRILKPLIFQIGIPVEEGAETLVYLASSPDVAGINGKYFYKKEARDSLPLSYNIKDQKRLWELSEKMVGLQT